MKVLVTNDDGIDSPGLHALAGVAARLGHDVVVVAPNWEASGASASLTAVEHDGRLLVERRELECLRDVEAFAVEATPAFIVRAAMTGAFGDVPELVLAGINHGPNTGHAVLHSGTVGAAFTATTFGIRAVAVSLRVGPTARWETAAAVAEVALPWAAGLAEPLVVNINVPDVALADLTAFERADLAPFGAVQTTITERGAGYVRLAYDDVPTDKAAERTDAALLARGVATFTVLRAVCAVDDRSLPFPLHIEVGNRAARLARRVAPQHQGVRGA